MDWNLMIANDDDDKQLYNSLFTGMLDLKVRGKDRYSCCYNMMKSVLPEIIIQRATSVEILDTVTSLYILNLLTRGSQSLSLSLSLFLSLSLTHPVYLSVK